MRHERKTKQQLIVELESLREQLELQQMYPKEKLSSPDPVKCQVGHSMSSAIVKEATAEQIISQAIAAARRGFPAMQIAYSVIGPDGLMTVLESAQPDGWPSLTGVSFDLNSTPTYLAKLRELKAVVIEDLEKDTSIWPTSGNSTNRAKASVEIPTERADRSLGILCCLALEAQRWTDNDICVLTQVADHISLALSNIDELRRRKQAEEALARETERLAVTLNSIADGVIATDANMRIAFMNASAERITGWSQSEALSKELCSVVKLVDERTGAPSECPAPMVLQTGRFQLSDHIVLISHSGDKHAISDTCSPIRDSQGNIVGVVLVFRDVTDQRKADAEILKASKLESVGLLAGGIAHDFNNILTAILGNISLALYTPSLPFAAQQRLKEAERACLRASELTQQLLTFAKGGAPVRRPLSIGKLLREAVSIATGGSNVACDLYVPQNLWPIEADRGQLAQVFRNILQNAREATENGLITVRAKNVAFEEDEITSTSLVPAGRYVEVTVEDNGSGIDPEDMKNIFDPFFTTKDGHSGLGLATAYSIVTHHRGYMRIESEKYHGTVVMIHLPMCEELRDTSVGEEGHPLRARGRVLVMDDELTIRELCRQVLNDAGFEVLTSADGLEAISLYQEALSSGKRFDAVVLDLTVRGGVGGKETVKRLLEIDPSACVIVSSGYSNDPVLSDFRSHGFAAMVPKPYEGDQLVKTIRHSLQKTN